jgi:hypothetical protein
MYINTFYCLTSNLSNLAIVDNHFKNTGDFMNKIIILSLTIGLVFGYGVSAAIKNTDIIQLTAENIQTKKQNTKLSKQLLVVQKQLKQRPRLKQNTQGNTLTNRSLNKSSPARKKSFAQQKQAIARMRDQQLNPQKYMTEKNQNKANTLNHMGLIQPL